MAEAAVLIFVSACMYFGGYGVGHSGGYREGFRIGYAQCRIDRLQSQLSATVHPLTRKRTS